MRNYTVEHLLSNKTSRTKLTHAIIPKENTYQLMEPCGSTEEFYIIKGNFTKKIEVEINPFSLYRVEIAKRDNIGYGELVKPALFNSITVATPEEIKAALVGSTKKVTLNKLVKLVNRYIEYHMGIEYTKEIRAMTEKMERELGVKIKNIPASAEGEPYSKSKHHATKGGLVQHTAEMLGMLIHGVDIRTGNRMQNIERFSGEDKSALALAILFHDLGKIYNTEDSCGIKSSGHLAASLAIMQSYVNVEGKNGINEAIVKSCASLMLSHSSSTFYNINMRSAIGKYYTLTDKSVQDIADYLDDLDKISASVGSQVVLGE